MTTAPIHSGRKEGRREGGDPSMVVEKASRRATPTTTTAHQSAAKRRTRKRIFFKEDALPAGERRSVRQSVKEEGQTAPKTPSPVVAAW